MTYEHTIPEGALLAYVDQPVRSPISGNVSHWLIVHTKADDTSEVVGGFEINQEASTPGNLAYYAAVFVDGIPRTLARTCSARYLARRMVIEAHRAGKP